MLGQENKQVTKANLWNSVVCIVYTAEFAKGTESAAKNLGLMTSL